MKLREFAQLVRSKNAGVDHVTVDFIFKEYEDYRKLIDSVPLDISKIAEIYGVNEENISHFLALESMKTLKFTLKRPRSGGSPGEHDLYGSQFYIPLAEMEVKR